VACDGRDFYRITDKALQVFGVSKHIPPPQIRGSAVAGQTARMDVAEPLNVVALQSGSALVIAKGRVLRYDPEQKKIGPSTSIATPAPLLAWLDAPGGNSFVVRVLGESSLHGYRLPALGRSDSSPRTAPAERALPEFDSRLFTVLADGAPLYSTPRGLVRAGSETPPTPLPKLAGPATVLFADASRERFWTADASGRLSLWEQGKDEAPVFSAHVPGVVIDTAIQGDRVAVLSMELRSEMYRPSVTIFSKGEQVGQLAVAPSPVAFGRPQLDVCLITGRPWVVVGGRHWLQLLEWTSPRLLAEW
jgi:hypothetical protein